MKNLILTAYSGNYRLRTIIVLNILLIATTRIAYRHYVAPQGVGGLSKVYRQTDKHTDTIVTR